MAGGPVPDEVARFNAFVAEQAAADQRDKAVRRAEAAKQQAAARVREVLADPRASREERQGAEQAYREAVAAWQAARAGEPEPEPEAEAEAEAEAEPVEAG